MQIFILDADIQKNAESYCDKHVVKIITEICQILCTRSRQFHGELPDFCYKSTHNNHPLIKWCGESTGNWEYTVKIGQALLDEYYYRYEKYDKHLRNKTILNHFDKTFPIDVFPGPRTEFIQCIPEKYKQKDTITAYREYYREEKKHFAKYTKRKPPIWL